VLADGVGALNLAERAGHAPFLSRQPTQVMTAGFPSTTVASLAALGTGLAPGQTGLAGYSLRDPVSGQPACLIKWQPVDPPERWQPHSTWFERLAEAGHPAAFVGRPRFNGSALTTAALRGARFCPAEGATAWVRAGAAAAQTGGVVYLYWANLDKTGHAKGWRSHKWASELEEFDSAVRQLARTVGPGTEVWVTADHGLVDVDPALTRDIATTPELTEGVEVVAGEPRMVHLYGPEPEAIAARWRAVLGPDAWVLTRPEALAHGLFGPVETRVMPLIGDVIAASAGTAAVVDSRSASPDALAMVGHHGSLTETEMRLPLVRATL